MIRTIGTRVILPKGDSGSFRLPVKSDYNSGNSIAVFSVYDKLTRKTIIEKEFPVGDDSFVYINLSHKDSADIEVGKYWWDVKIYYLPKRDEDGKLIDAMQIDSIYATHRMATFIISEVGKE